MFHSKIRRLPQRKQKALFNRRDFFIRVFLFLAFFAGAETGFSQDAAGERREIFEQVWTTISEKYYDANFNGIDWRRVRADYEPLIEQAKSETEFYEFLDRMVGELRDSHTRFYSPDQVAARRRRQAAQTGIKLAEIQGKIVILSVAPASEAARAGVKPGMIVRAVGGQPIEKALAEARAAVGFSSSARSTRMRVFSKILAGEAGADLKLELTDEKGKVLSAALRRQTIAAAPNLTAELLPSGLAYLKLNQFVPGTDREVKEALEKFRSAPGLILDLRGNQGGDGETGLRIAGYFFNDETTIARLVTRTGNPPAPEMPMVLTAGSRGGQTYSNPLVILIDEASASTTELITSAIQEQKRGKVIGSGSCGCVLGVLSYREIKGGGGLTVSEFGFVTPQGRRLEGSGVTPDKTVEITLGDLRKNRDAALDEARKRLAELTGSKN